MIQHFPEDSKLDLLVYHNWSGPCVRCGVRVTFWWTDDSDRDGAMGNEYCDRCFPEHLKVLYALQRLP